MTNSRISVLVALLFALPFQAPVFAQSAESADASAPVKQLVSPVSASVQSANAAPAQPVKDQVEAGGKKNKHAAKPAGVKAVDQSSASASADIPKPGTKVVASVADTVQYPPAPAQKAADLAPKPVPKRAFPEQVMPGIGTMPGDKQLQRDNIVRIGSGRNEIVYVSIDFPNRIATPFASPHVIDNSEIEVDYHGQSAYVTPKAEKPIGIYITGSNPNDPVVSLTLVPKSIPQQTIIIQPDISGGYAQGGDAKDDAPTGNAYTERIRYLMRQVALGKTPEGFAQGALPRAMARMGNVVVSPEIRYSGTTYDIYRYRVENATPNSIELDEGAFYTDGVRAVSFFPTTVLNKGEYTSVFVIADKSSLTGGQ